MLFSHTRLHRACTSVYTSYVTRATAATTNITTAATAIPAIYGEVYALSAYSNDD